MGPVERMFYIVVLCITLMVCSSQISRGIGHLTAAVDRLTTQIQHEQTFKER